MIDVKKLTKKIREAVYGLDVRESIAEGFDATYENELEHEANTKKQIDDYTEATNEKIQAQNERIDELKEHYDRVIESGAENPNMLEIVEARQGLDGEFRASLKQRIDDVEEGALNSDIIIGTEKFRRFLALDEEGEVNGHIDIHGASFKELSVSQLNCDNVISIGNKSTTTIEITADDNIQQVIDTIPKYLIGNVNINVSGVHYGDINLHGFMGIGELNFYLTDGAEIHGSIYVNSSTTQVVIQSNECKGKLYHDSTRESAIRVMSSPYTNIHAIEITAKSTSSKNGVYASMGAGVRVGNCKINGFLQYSYYANQCSRLYAVDNTGNDNQKCYYATGGSTLGLKGKAPMSKVEGTVDTGAQALGSATMTGTITGVDTPTVEATKTATFGCASMKSYRAVDGWKSGKVYQGKYNSSNPSSYNYYGLYVLGDTIINQIKSTLSGKTIKSVKMTVKRNSEGGTDTAGVSINLCGTTSTGIGSTPAITKTYKTNMGTIRKGATYTATIPNVVITDIMAGTIKSLMLHKTDQTNYSIFADTFSLEVVYV